MKKILSAGIVSLFIILGICFIKFEVGSQDVKTRDEAGLEDTGTFVNDEIRQKISSVYEIPASALERLPADIILRLFSDIEAADIELAKDTYWKICTDKNGTSIACEFPYQDYSAAMHSNNKNEDTWVKTHMAVIDKGDVVQIAVLCSWLTKPVFHLKNIVGLSVVQGTVIDNSADGFCSYVTSDGSFYCEDFHKSPSEFSYSGGNIIRSVSLEKADEIVKDEMVFMKANIYKEGASETVVGVYAYEEADIPRDCLFTINETGLLSAVNQDLDLTAHQCRGRIFAQW